MNIRQLSIFIENKPGRLYEISEVLGKAGIDIRALSIADTSEFGILRLIVDDVDKALTALKTAEITASVTNVLAAGVDDCPGAFSKVMKYLAEDHITVEYMYAFISRSKGRAVVIIRADDQEKAKETLKKNGVPILCAKDLFSE